MSWSSGPKKRNPRTDQHWNARDDEMLYEPGLEKMLNGDAAIDVAVADSARA